MKRSTFIFFKILNFFFFFNLTAAPPAVFSASPRISVVGRFGQNSDINGEYSIVNNTDNSLPLYIQNTNTDELYIFRLRQDDIELWVIGEKPYKNEGVRAFVEAGGKLMSPEDVEGVWKVFEENPLTLELQIIPDKFLQIRKVSCNNYAKDGDEEGVDCGGICPRKCKEYKICILPKNPPSSYAFGTCFKKNDTRTGENISIMVMNHGDVCEYHCPIGYLTRGVVGRACYDGTLLQVKRGFPCLSGFPSRPCPHIEISGEKDVLGDCLGTFANDTVSISLPSSFSSNSTSSSPSESYIWFRENANNEKIHLYWKDGEWICTNLKKKINFGYIPDDKPYRFTKEGGFESLAVVESDWLTPQNEEKATKVSMRCYVPNALNCPTLYVQSKDSSSFGELIEGSWTQIHPTSSGERPRYIHPSGLRIYWINQGYWVVDLEDDSSEFMGFVFSLEFSPPGGNWQKWNTKSKKWEKVEIHIKCFDVHTRAAQELNDEDKVDDGEGAVRLGVLKGGGGAIMRIRNVSNSAIDGLSQSVIFPTPSKFKIRPALISSYENSPCIRLSVSGATGKASDCNGVYTRVIHNEANEVFWYKLLSDSTVLYFYWFSGKWGCTANDGAVKGYIVDNNGGYPTQLLQKNALSSSLSMPEKVVSKGLWVSSAGYDENENSSVQCTPPLYYQTKNNFNAHKECPSLALSQFAGAAGFFNGSWMLSELRINGRLHFVRKVQNKEMHIYYNRQGLWVISLSVDRTGVDTFPYVAYTYSAEDIPPTGIWAVFDSGKNRAVMNSVYAECKNILVEENESEKENKKQHNNKKN